jgi:hypothetical protein
MSSWRSAWLSARTMLALMTREFLFMTTETCVAEVMTVAEMFVHDDADIYLKLRSCVPC